MKKFLILPILCFNLSYTTSYAQDFCPTAKNKMENLLSWLIEKQQVKQPIRNLPTLVPYKNVSKQDKKQYCPWCPLETSPQLNMFITQKNEIWLEDNAKEDQVVHELAHFLQSVENEEQENESSSELETQAVYWQNKYKETHINRLICE